MLLKKCYESTLILILIIYNLPLYAQPNPFGQIVTIETHFKTMYGQPTWLLILRNVKSGLVLPYLYNFNSEDNFWLALTYGPMFQITVSTLTFGPFAEIKNFCCLENRVLDHMSMKITLTGTLSPVREGIKCHVTRWDMPGFTVANIQSD